MQAATASIHGHEHRHSEGPGPRPESAAGLDRGRRRARAHDWFTALPVLACCGLLGACGSDQDPLAGPPGEPSGVATPPSSGDPDCPPATVCDDVPAAYARRDPKSGNSYGNYDLANRPLDGQEVRYIVIHTTDASWDLTKQIFQDPTNAAAAHYLVRSSDGHIAKFVAPRHVAWHAGNWYYNMHSIGIEHEAWAFEGHKWFSDALYSESAKLVRYLARRYGVPLDRAHILGHDEVPGISQARQKSMHWDPGPYWDWDRYMKLLRAPETAGPDGEPADEQPDTLSDASAAGRVITVAPDYAQNLQPVTYCYSPDEASDCHDAPVHPVHFLYLRQAPDPLAPLLENPYLTAWPGDRMYNWANKVGTGTRWVLAERRGDWDAIYFSGQKAWFHNPGHKSTRLAEATVVTPRAGLATAPVFGVGYPQAAAYLPPKTPVAMEQTYQIAAGQKYLAMQRVTADYYWARTYVEKDKYGTTAEQTVIKDGTEYFLINFNHREALVRVADMELVRSR